tara:strand:- start:2857 stop:3558 length:702 start_codon:yes stop_codon:yes gene_type:complete
MKLEKTNKVKNIFNRVSNRYDLLNNLLSFGLHNLWKRKLVNYLNPKNGENWADLCCGTGDMAILISKKIHPRGSVLGIDSAEEILEIAKKRSDKKYKEVLKWNEQDIFDMDELTQNFDGIIMSYGLRNLNDIQGGLRKVFLLLKERGRAGFLDFNHARNRSASSIFQKMYLRLIVVPISRIFNLSQEYAYIEKSINNFPNGKRLIFLAKKVGFREVFYKEIFFGQMGILLVLK